MIPGRILPNLRAITLWRPWSDAIARGPKRIENRTWVPPRQLLGCHIAIHAGKQYQDKISYPEHWVPPPLCFMGIVGVARLAGIYDARETQPRIYFADGLSPKAKAELEASEQNPWWVGPVGWFLDDVGAIDPVDCKGALGVWDVPMQAANEVRRKWIAARAA
jgi:hypothetical protein